ncbi:hypothetical protein BaRGS_00014492 [Batillaria attramentaria]|uniref:Uncharacterized protein n=1 Tax=Batillaria attramentaria TaxID=370345 RepID=A0ABD0L422_9CAEN
MRADIPLMAKPCCTQENGQTTSSSVASKITAVAVLKTDVSAITTPSAVRRNEPQTPRCPAAVFLPLEFAIYVINLLRSLSGRIADG